MNGVCLLSEADADRMAALHRAAFATGEQWSAQAFADLMALPSTYAFGVEADIGLKGLLLVQQAVEVADILTIGVARPHRRGGVAGELLKAATQILGTKGVGRLVLDVAVDNEAALAFYRAHGFEENGVRKNYYQRLDGRRVDAMLMSRPLLDSRVN